MGAVTAPPRIQGEGTSGRVWQAWLPALACADMAPVAGLLPAQRLVVVAPHPDDEVLACGALIVTLSMGIRHGFGLWLQPITQAQGWTRENFAFAMAIQNLAWGCFGIFAGMAADRFGAFRVLVGGAVLYGLGLAGMALTTTPLGFALTTGVLIGAAQAGTTYAVIYGVIGRQIPAEKRSWAMGVAAAAGSFGQFLMVPIEGWLISSFGWQEALLVLGAAVLLIMPLALFLLVAVFLYRGLFLNPAELPSAMIGKPMPAFDMRAAIADRPGLSLADLQDGKPKLLNIWASWCVPV